MFNLSRFVSGKRPETEDEFRIRMEKLHTNMEELARKRPEEVAGDTREGLYYSLKALDAFQAGDQAEGRRMLDEMLRAAPLDTIVRLIASTCYRQIEDETEEMAQLAIILALEPKSFTVHTMLAKRLIKQGQPQVAQAVLEKGWSYYRNYWPKAKRETERARYFSMLQQAA